MKYVTPKYEVVVIETEDILTTSKDFEISKTDTGDGKIELLFSNLFG